MTCHEKWMLMWSLRARAICHAARKCLELRMRPDIDDVVTDAIIHAARNYDPDSGPAGPYLDLWVRKMCGRWRSRRNTSPVNESDASSRIVPGGRRAYGSPIFTAEARRGDPCPEALDEIIRRAGVRRRDAEMVRLRYVSGMTTGEIGAAYGVSAVRASQIIGRAEAAVAASPHATGEWAVMAGGAKGGKARPAARPLGRPAHPAMEEGQKLLLAGCSQPDVARIMRVTEDVACHWAKRLREAGKLPPKEKQCR